jgi:single-strand DNA-binding protein
MAKSVNQVILIGRLTREPEVRSTTSGKTITTFSLAVDKFGEGTDFFEVTAWEKLGELVSQYLSKGSKVFVQGRLQQDSWDDKDTGAKRSKVTITANDITFLDSKSDDGSGSNPRTQNEILEESGQFTKKTPEDKPIDLSEIPF